MAINAYVYMLQCADGSYYVGSTIDLERRLGQHQNGEGAAYTRRPGRLPVTLVYVEDFDQISDAFAREKQIQNWSRAKRQALIDRRYAELPKLAKGRYDMPGYVSRRSGADEDGVSTSSTTEDGVSTSSTTEDGVSTSSTTEDGVSTSSTTEDGVSTSSTTETPSTTEDDVR
ncbi:GIY-YIG nuclease family protein [Nocardioides plantarum]|uniref:GIY-YIG nuclease family protein n=1 Tax=Nocardioides plantarum TaxID=29299 RepID=A0ABV5KEE0_9ACTN